MSDTQGGFTINLFGAPAVVGPDGDRPLSPFQIAMLALVYAEGSITRPELGRILWGADADSTVRHRIRQLRHGIKRRLGQDLVVAKGDALLARADLNGDMRSYRVAMQAGQLLTASTLVRIGFLGGLSAGVSDAFDDWREAYSATLGRRLRSAIATTWQAASNTEDWSRARDAAEALYLLEPTDPVAVLRVIEARARTGKTRPAESAYAEYCDSLAGGAEPTPEIQELMDRVRRIGHDDQVGETLQTAFVGRRDGLERLGRVVKDVRGGSFSFALISGEAGIGKTRLLREAERLAHLEGVRCLLAQPVELERRISLNPILDAVSKVDVEDHLDALGEPWRTVIGTLLPAGSLRSPVGKPPPIDETSLSRRLLDGVSLLLERIADERPTILFLDDMQWADATTIAVLQFFQRRWKESHFGVVAVVRPELVDTKDPAASYLTGEAGLSVTHIELGELSEEEALLLVESIGQDRISVATTQRLFQLAGLHPLYLTELARDYLAERLTLPEKPEDSVSIPVSLREILASRTSALSKGTMEVAGLIATGAGAMRLADIASILDTSIDSAADAADELMDAGLVDVERDRVWIRHDLFRSAIYGELTEARRAVLHRKHAEHLVAGGSDEAFNSLAIHYDRAGESELAAAHGWTAGERAMESGAVAEAAHFYDLVTRNESDSVQRAIGTAKLATALHLNRDISRANPALELASSRLRAAGMSDRARRMDIRRVEGLSEAGDTPTEDLIERLGAIKADATEAEDWEAVALALDVELKLLNHLGDIGRIREVFQKMEQVSEAGGAAASAVSHFGLAMGVLFGDPDAALESAWLSVRLSETAEIYRLKSLMRLMAALQLRGRLQLPSARKIVDEARALAAQSGDARLRFSVESNLAVALLDAGELDQAEQQLERSTSLLGSASMDRNRFIQANNHAELALARSDFDQAREWFELAGQYIGSTTPSYASQLVNAGLGLCALESGNLSEARKREELVGPVAPPWYFDPSTVLSFQARLLERRGETHEALHQLSVTSDDIQGRLDLAWLKIGLLRLEKMRKWGITEDARTLAIECLRKAEELNLPKRREQFYRLLHEQPRL